MSNCHFETDLAACVWDLKYRLRENGEMSVEDTWRRVARALASVETTQQGDWETRFYRALEDFRFLPGGRILAGAGSRRQVTLFNCFVMGRIEDSLNGIFEALKEGALTMQQGGGVGYDFSTLRPRGDPAVHSGAVASGPVSCMRIWDAMCATILSTGARRGAMMATLRCDHPDITSFISAKREKTELRHFNLSLLVSDDFMRAVADDADWPLVFPLAADNPSVGEVVMRSWPGAAQPRACRVYRRTKARQLWQEIMRANYDCAEPGVIFIDRMRRANNLWYSEEIIATNPCGEIPLPAYGACNLGSINLTRFIENPFTPDARVDFDGIRITAETATRMLDNVYDVSRFPLVRQAEVAKNARRLGLGITGLADALIMLDAPYGSEPALAIAKEIMGVICETAYLTSAALAREKGPFPAFVAKDYLQGEFIRALAPDIRAAIEKNGLRNSHLTAIAPAGSISILAGDLSSGLEPVFAFQYQRRLRNPDGTTSTVPVTDYAYRRFRHKFGAGVMLPHAFVTGTDIKPEAQLAMQAALQRFVDNAISKTISVPQDFGFDAFRVLFEEAYGMGLKGCTTFRPNAVTGAVLVEAPRLDAVDPCCGAGR